jgi:hypothetical protein
MANSISLIKRAHGQAAVERVELASFRKVDDLAAGLDFFVVVKSQDQQERRQRMLKSLSTGRLGRIAKRPVAEGLLLRGSFCVGAFRPAVVRPCREPRHIAPLPSGGYLLTEMNRLLHVDEDGAILRAYTNPYFSYLHSVKLNSNATTALLASSGYDSLMELDLKTGDIVWHWLAWEHGFNPDEEGVWLAATPAAQTAYEAEGKTSLVVHPDTYGEQGLLVARRSAHPNCAIFEDARNEWILCSIGAYGRVYRISKATGAATEVIDWLSSMPHGLSHHHGQWIVTNTTRGEFWILNEDFTPRTCIDFASLPGKVEGTGEAEWLQQVAPISKSRFIAVDSNRAIFCFDLEEEAYTPYRIDPDYCVQDVLLAR